MIDRRRNKKRHGCQVGSDDPLARSSEPAALAFGLSRPLAVRVRLELGKRGKPLFSKKTLRNQQAVTRLDSRGSYCDTATAG